MISAFKREGRLKGSVCKISDVKFKDPLNSILYWGHQIPQTELYEGGVECCNYHAVRA